MTTETGCRVSADELKHDRTATEVQKRRDELYFETRAQFYSSLTRGELAEAATILADIDAGDRAVAAYHRMDYASLGILLSAAIGSWLSLQAVKEVDRMIERGEV